MIVYHEFVYVSGAKVRQFVPARPAWWRGMRARKLGVNLKFSPVEASLEVEPSEIGDDDRRLAKLMQYLETSGRYYTAPDVVPGEWIMFDGRIGITSVDTPPVRGAVLFCEAEPFALTTPRIMLHGSSHHMAPGVSPTPAEGPVTGEDGGYSLLSADGVAAIIEAASNARRSERAHAFGAFLDRPAHENSELYQHLAAYFREVACVDEYRDFAPYLGGHAKVTAVLRPQDLPFPVVLASPLYVRYERP